MPHPHELCHLFAHCQVMLHGFGGFLGGFLGDFVCLYSEFLEGRAVRQSLDDGLQGATTRRCTGIYEEVGRTLWATRWMS